MRKPRGQSLRRKLNQFIDIHRRLDPRESEFQLRLDYFLEQSVRPELAGYSSQAFALRVCEAIIFKKLCARDREISILKDLEQRIKATAEFRVLAYFLGKYYQQQSKSNHLALNYYNRGIQLGLQECGLAKISLLINSPRIKNVEHKELEVQSLKQFRSKRLQMGISVYEAVSLNSIEYFISILKKNLTYQERLLVLFNYGLFSLKLKNLETAIQLFEMLGSNKTQSQAIRLYSLINLSRVHEELGDYHKAHSLLLKLSGLKLNAVSRRSLMANIARVKRQASLHKPGQTERCTKQTEQVDRGRSVSTSGIRKHTLSKTVRFNLVNEPEKQRKTETEVKQAKQKDEELEEQFLGNPVSQSSLYRGPLKSEYSKPERQITAEQLDCLRNEFYYNSLEHPELNLQIEQQLPVHFEAIQELIEEALPSSELNTEQRQSKGDSSEWRQYCEEGEQEVQRDNYMKAISCFQKAVSVADNCEELTKMYERFPSIIKNFYPQKLRILHRLKCLEKFEETLASLLRIKGQTELREDIAKLEEMYAVFLLSQRVLERGLTRIGKREYEEAGELFKQALRVNPQNYTAAVELAKLMICGNKEQSAKIILTEILKKESGYWQAHLLLGLIEQRQNSLGPALTHYRHALKLTSFAQAFLFSSRVYFRMGDQERTLKMARQCLLNEPDQHEAWRLMAVAQSCSADEQHKKSSELIFKYLSLWEKEPLSKPIRNSKLPELEGYLEFKNKNYKSALAEFHKLDDYQQNIYNKGCCFLKLQEYELAFESFRRVVELNDSFAEAYLGLFASSYYRGRYEESQDYLQKAIKLQPENELWNELLKEYSETAIPSLKTLGDESVRPEDRV